jgi:proline iminopeptidase
MILCNGGPGCCDYLGPVAEMVDDLVHVYRFEPRGCGRSAMGGPYDLATSLADLEALRVHFGHDSWIVGGHSWGAFLALAYSLEYPGRAEKIVYLSGSGIQNDREWHAAYLAGRDAGLELEPDFAYPVNRDVNRVGNASTRAYIKDPTLFRRIAELDVSLLAISGSEDIRPNWPVQQLVNLMPNSRFELLDGAPHDLWLTHSNELQSLVRDFVASHQ